MVYVNYQNEIETLKYFSTYSLTPSPSPSPGKDEEKKEEEKEDIIISDLPIQYSGKNNNHCFENKFINCNRTD